MNNNEKKALSFVILTWNSGRYIEKCLESYAKTVNVAGISAEFLIVDNGSTDDTAQKVEKFSRELSQNFSLKIFKLAKNLGTTVSRNIALKEVLGENIVICDSDTEFLSGNLLDAVNYLKDNPNAGLIAPLMVYEDGTVQPSVKLFPTITDKISKLKKIFCGIPAKSDFYSRFPWNEIKPVDTAISAFWMFKKELLEIIGYLDEKIFYSPEDIDFCIRIWEAKKHVLFYPKLKIKHKTQQLTHANPFSRCAFSHFAGILYNFKKHKYFLSRPRLQKKLGITVNEFEEIIGVKIGA